MIVILSLTDNWLCFYELNHIVATVLNIAEIYNVEVILFCPL